MKKLVIILVYLFISSCVTQKYHTNTHYDDIKESILTFSNDTISQDLYIPKFIVEAEAAQETQTSSRPLLQSFYTKRKPKVR